MINIGLVSILQKKGMIRKLALMVISIIMITGLFYPHLSLAYKTDVHMRITQEAINQNTAFLNGVMNNIGFPGGVGQQIKGFEEKSILNEWA